MEKQFFPSFVRSFLSSFLPSSVHSLMTCVLSTSGLWILGTQTKIRSSASLQDPSNLDWWDKPAENQYGSGELQTAVSRCRTWEGGVPQKASGVSLGVEY